MADTQYTKYYVAFLDILGFKNLISGSESTCQSILNIYKEFGTIHDELYSDIPEGLQNVNIKIMSDSICVYIEADKPNALWSLILYCTGFQYSSLIMPQHILMRGGIVLGDMFIENDIAFGPALTQAYLLEEKNAKVPRIIMLKETLDYGRSQTDKIKAELMKKFTFRDDDAFYTLNYFLLFRPNFSEQDILDQVKTVVSGYLNTTIDESVRQKYLYVEKNMRKYLKENPDA